MGKKQMTPEQLAAAKALIREKYMTTPGPVLGKQLGISQGRVSAIALSMGIRKKDAIRYGGAPRAGERRKSMTLAERAGPAFGFVAYKPDFTGRLQSEKNL